MNVGQFATLDDGDGGGGNARLLQYLGGDAVDAAAQGGVDGVDRLSWGLRRRRAGGEQKGENC